MGSAYKIVWSHGVTEHADTYEDAIGVVRAVLSDPAIGHDGDISCGGRRTLCWASEELACDDDGSRAACSIARVEAVAS